MRKKCITPKTKKWIILSLVVIVLFVSVFATVKHINRFNNKPNLPNQSIVFDSTNTKYCHFSIDDSISIFEDLTKNKNSYDSIFDQPIISFFKQLHEDYGIVVSFYVFYSWDLNQNGFDLSKSTDKYVREFEDNSDWIRFGFHAKDADAYENLTSEIEKEYYQKTIKELERIVGKKSIDSSFLRLDRYIADEKTIVELEHLGVKGLLTAPDKNRVSYALTEYERELCYYSDWYVDKYGMQYTPTDIQIENIENDSEFYESVNGLSNQPRIEVFTHEWALEEKYVKKYLIWYSYAIKCNNIEFVFPHE